MASPPLPLSEDFPQFRKLPSELRRMIWNECLPARRVVELDYPVRHAYDEFSELVRVSWCRLHATTTQNGRWPLISRVCRESRAVVVETRCADIPPWLPGLESLACDWLSQPQGCWIRSGQDVINLNFHAAGDYGDGSFVEIPERPDPIPWAAEVANKYEAAEVSLAAAALFPFGPSKKPDLNWEPWEAEDTTVWSLGRCKQKKYLMCLQTVTVHASTAEASLLGDDLFGTLGDSPIALIDPISDWKSIEKARLLWQTFSPTDAEAASFFEQAAEAEELQARVSEWSRSATKLWFYFSWMRKRANQGTALLTEEDFLSLTPLFRRILISTAMDIPEDDLWEDFPPMPELQPVIMFRLCPAKCHREVQDPCEVDHARKEASRERLRRLRARRRVSGRGRGSIARTWWYPPRVQHEPEE
ncbi:hypothetical protein F5X68DRAFT_196579 [Plectosphaerella plurivora]|uniref:2EXR domain-containing protein n=1 Tax=Plectosphaerella plurivora TaxID=936078 RepID=A0A9P8VK74_9PEZI|nr:hypothetical protein F5X68DRAFT_196579 [Plectosphaerella plurivora]